MKAPSSFQLVSNSNIDRTKWDACIRSAAPSFIYAYSFYLDGICPGWGALTGGEYEWVLPVTYRQKVGVSYLYQPPFTQQLGVFAPVHIDVPFQSIFHWLQQRYKFWEISWNAASVQHHIPSSIQVSAATNMVLPLSQKYKAIAANYHKDLNKNLKRSSKFRLMYTATNDYHKCISLYKQHYRARIAHVTADDYNRFANICKHALEHNMLVCRQAMNENEEMLAAALLLQKDNRLYNLMNTTTEAGRKVEANHFLLDAVIREFSGSDVKLDFEGSDIPGVKRFYENFGAVNEPYYMLRYNNLPWLLRLIKK